MTTLASSHHRNQVFSKSAIMEVYGLASRPPADRKKYYHIVYQRTVNYLLG
jgi:hypothetical protein